jgi:TPR repeat protein
MSDWRIVLFGCVVIIAGCKGNSPNPPTNSPSPPSSAGARTCQGDVEKLIALDGSPNAKEAYLRQMSESHFRDWEASESAGNPDGQLIMGFCHALGIVVQQDNKVGRQLSMLAADAGHAYAMKVVGSSYFKDRKDLPKDYAEAFRWFRKSADHGCACGMCAVGCCFQRGYGVPKDCDEAAKWLRMAAEAGNIEAMEFLGALLVSGDGIPPSPQEAAKWFEKAAGNGAPGAMCNLGIMLLRGYGIPRDYERAGKLLLGASDKGSPEASCNLGDMYAHGLGVKRDLDKAAVLYRKAIRTGDQKTRECAKKSLEQTQATTRPEQD